MGSTRLHEADYTWLTGYVRQLKVDQNLSPTSIKHRVQALGRAIDEYLRHHPEVKLANPVKLLPRGYANYGDAEAKVVQAKGQQPKATTVRDRRLLPGEHEKIVQVLSGYERPDRPRGLQLQRGDALLTLYLLILYTGVRLQEAFTLRRHQVNLDGRIVRVQTSKQWRGKVVYRDVPLRPEAHAALVPAPAAMQPRICASLQTTQGGRRAGAGCSRGDRAGSAAARGLHAGPAAQSGGRNVRQHAGAG